MGGGPEKVPKKRHEFTVLVTGMGPFPDGQGGHYDASHNTSHLVTKQLPELLPASHPANLTSLPIRILNPTSPPGKYVKTEYLYIRNYVQALWDEYQDEVDLVLHLGMADGWEWYTIERLAFKEGFSSAWWGGTGEDGYYLMVDDEGKNVRDIEEGKGRGRWKDALVGLQTGIDVDQAAGDANRALGFVVAGDGGNSREPERTKIGDSAINKGANVKDDGGEARKSNEGSGKLKIEVRPHLEAGSYCCGFIYYESLATCWERKLDTAVIFSHVPGWTDAERLRSGAATVCAIIGAACKQIEEKTRSK